MAKTDIHSLLLSRLRQAKRYYGLSNARIAEAAGMTVATVTNQLQGKYKPDIDLVLGVLSLCPTLSAEWLMRGTGEMEGKSEVARLADAVARLAERLQK